MDSEEDSFNEFLAASVDDEEPLVRVGYSRGGSYDPGPTYGGGRYSYDPRDSGREYGRGAGSAYNEGYGYGGRGDRGYSGYGGYGSPYGSATGGRGAMYGGGMAADPLASINLDALPAKKQGQLHRSASGTRQDDVRTSSASRLSNEKGISKTRSTSSLQPGPGTTSAASSRARDEVPGARGSFNKSKSADPPQMTRTFSDASESGEQSQTLDSLKEQDKPSDFSAFLKEMQQLSNSVDELKKKQEDDEARLQLEQEEAKKRREEEEQARIEAEKREKELKEEEERAQREAELKKKAEEEQRKKEEEERKTREEKERKEEEERRKREEEECAKKEAEEKERQKQEEEERLRKQEEDAQKARELAAKEAEERAKREEEEQRKAREREEQAEREKKEREERLKQEAEKAREAEAEKERLRLQEASAHSEQEEAKKRREEEEQGRIEAEKREKELKEEQERGQREAELKKKAEEEQRKKEEEERKIREEKERKEEEERRKREEEERARKEAEEKEREKRKEEERPRQLEEDQQKTARELAAKEAEEHAKLEEEDRWKAREREEQAEREKKEREERLKQEAEKEREVEAEKERPRLQEARLEQWAAGDRLPHVDEGATLKKLARLSASVDDEPMGSTLKKPPRPSFSMDDEPLVLVASQPKSERGVGVSPAAETPEAVSRLQSELEMTERMLRGCEKENESLAQQNRQLREASRIQKEAIDERQLQLVAELNAARASADANPASMRRLSELERELVVAKERAKELGIELERAREAKRALERELLTGPKPSEGPDMATQLEAVTTAARQAESDLAELKEKLRWYAEGQKEMEEDRREVSRLREEVTTLRKENAELRHRPTSKDSQRRVAELRAQVEELQECLRKKNPDSILALMKACEPRPEEKREVRTLRQRIEELEGKLAERDEIHDRQLRGLRARYDSLRQAYEKRSQTRASTPSQEAGAGRSASTEPKGAGPDREAVLIARVKDLERQVEHTKSYYLSKLRKKEPLVPTGPKPKAPRTSQAQSAAPPSAPTSHQVREEPPRTSAEMKPAEPFGDGDLWQHMRGPLEESMPPSAPLQAWSIHVPVSHPTPLPTAPPPPQAAAEAEVRARAAELESENANLRTQVQRLTARCQDTAAMLAQSPAQAVRKLQADIAELQSRLHEQQTSQATAARKTEITLRGELEVSRHEVSTLRAALEVKDQEVAQYQRELDEIICELMALRGTPART